MVRQLAHEIKNPPGGVARCRGAAARARAPGSGTARIHAGHHQRGGSAHAICSTRCWVRAGRRPSNWSTSTNCWSGSTICCAARRPRASTVDRDYDPSLPALTIDPNHIIQAMLNLGRNALQALSGGGDRGAASRAANPALPRTSASARSVTAWWPRSSSRTTDPGCFSEIRDTIFYPLVSGRADGSGLRSWGSPRIW